MQRIRNWLLLCSLQEGKDESSRLVIADSGSTDHTHEILEELKNSKYPKLEILQTANPFHGPKVIALYDYAIKNGIDYIFQTDSDGQTNPEEFDAFWQMRKKYAGIFGNKTMRGDGNDRAFVEKVVCFLSFSLLFVYFNEGNFTEEYAMTFISVSSFIFLDYLINGKISKLRLTICGFCFGGTLLLRPSLQLNRPR